MIRRIAPLFLLACADGGTVNIDDTSDTTDPSDTDVTQPGDTDEVVVDDPFKDEPEPVDVAITNVIVEVQYEPDAKPYVGNDGLFSSDPWNLFEVNIDALYAGSDIDVSFPRKLNGMTEMADLDETSFKVPRILEIARNNRATAASNDTSIVQVLWLNGNFHDGEAVQNGVIGVSIGSTGVIAMFKPTIRTLGNNEASRARGEQATLVHEFGHAAGLVNRSLPMTVDHQDTEHGKHCSNESCIMFWAIEGASGLSDFLGLNLGGDDAEVLFDDDCLDDVAAGLGVNR